MCNKHKSYLSFNFKIINYTKFTIIKKISFKDFNWVYFFYIFNILIHITYFCSCLLFLVAKLHYNSKYPSVHPFERFLFSAPIRDKCLIFFMKISLTKKHLIYNYFVFLSVDWAPKEENVYIRYLFFFY